MNQPSEAPLAWTRVWSYGSHAGNAFPHFFEENIPKKEGPKIIMQIFWSLDRPLVENLMHYSITYFNNLTLCYTLLFTWLGQLIKIPLRVCVLIIRGWLRWLLNFFAPPSLFLISFSAIPFRLGRFVPPFFSP